ncbi:MAG: NAD-dependent succinate-semialdehyde dehydrogenase [bacterium]|nr:NAD-dependent succinate-semialdehyde dehydrogenase [bacterium]
MNIQTINPATEEHLNNYECLKTSEINNKILKTHHAYLNWKRTAFDERRKLMLQLADTLQQKKAQLALLITKEMGKPITGSNAEIDKGIWLCNHYAEHAEGYLAPRFIQTEMKTATVCYKPMGIVFGIMPWNFPLWQVLRFAVPTMMAGNAAILKHAAITSGTGALIDRLFAEAGFPPNLFQHFIVDNEGAGLVIEHPSVTAITLTGSERAGRNVASHAGAFLKKTVLELGGSDPYVVLEDADLDLAASSIVASRLNNSGQVCISAKRIIAIKSIEKELSEKIAYHMSLYKIGNPLEPEINLGPLARDDLRLTLHNQVEKSLKQGANLLCGGIIPDCKGFYYPPTLISQVKPGMPAFDEELFGPVIAVITAKDEHEAISFANQGLYGLGAAVFTQDLQRGERIATEEIDAGVCFVNALVASDPRLPFGGIKNSGYGRELSKEGILEFVNIKTVVISDPLHAK